MNITTLGNTDLLKLPKTAFLCSRKAPASAVLKCYDWATEAHDTRQCVASGFHSPLEKDVLYFLMKRKQSVILVLGRAMYKEIPQELQQPLSDNRLLLISVSATPRQSEQTTDRRNRYIADISDRIVFGYINPEGRLQALYEHLKANGKDVHIL